MVKIMPKAGKGRLFFPFNIISYITAVAGTMQASVVCLRFEVS